MQNWIRNGKKSKEKKHNIEGKEPMILDGRHRNIGSFFCEDDCFEQGKS